MDHGRWPFPWSYLMVQLSWYDFLKKQFTKPLGPSLGVNQMWTKRNNHAPNVNVLIFLFYLNICPKRASLRGDSGEREREKFDLSCLLYSSSSLLQKKFHQQKFSAIFLCHGPLSFSTIAPLLPLTHHKTCWTMSMDNIGLEICL